MHGAHLLAEGRKMARSVGNVLRLADLRAEGVEPLAFRLLCLGIYYRGHMNVTWDSLKAAQSNLDRLRRYVVEWHAARTGVQSNAPTQAAADYHSRFMSAVTDDLGFPQALPIIWEMAKSDLSPSDKLTLILDWDRLMGLDLASAQSAPSAPLEPELLSLLDQRAAARAAKNYAAADRLRDELAARGLLVKDGKEGQTWQRMKDKG
jgi:cysteinyl-tRNA synthetase